MKPLPPLMDADGFAHVTKPCDEAELLVAALSRALNVDVVIAKTPFGNGDKPWATFKLPTKSHHDARTFIAGWDEGRRSL